LYGACRRSDLQTALIAGALFAVAALPARAGDPFQSAPGPAPQPRMRSPSLPPREPAPAAAPSAPPAPPPTSTNNSLVRAPSGVDARIVEHQAWGPDCTPRPVAIRIVDPPRSGTATICDETLPVSTAGSHPNNNPACVGRPIAGKSIYYKSNSGFRGPDRLGYLISYRNDEWIRMEARISVD
jgi:hypothetical protein